MKKLTLALIAMTMTSWAGAQGSEPASAPAAGHSAASAPKVVTRTVNAIERGARKTGAAIERGAVKTGEAVRRGVQKTGHGIKRGGEKLEEKAKAASGSN